MNMANMGLLKGAFEGDQGAVEQSLATGADVNASDQQGNTALHYAGGRGHEGICMILMYDSKRYHPFMTSMNNAALDAKNGAGNTPVNFAVYYGQERIVSLLIDKGADVDAGDNTSNRKGHEGISNLLVNKGNCRLDLVNNDGDTPLHRAARGGNPNIVSLLLSKGADAMARNRHGFTCIDLSANPQVKAVFNMPPPVRRTAPGIGGSSGLDALAALGLGPSSDPLAALGIAPARDPLAGLGLSSSSDPLAALGLSSRSSDPLAGLGIGMPSSDPLAALGLGRDSDPLAGLGISSPSRDPLAGLGLSSDPLAGLGLSGLSLPGMGGLPDPIAGLNLPGMSDSPIGGLPPSLRTPTTPSRSTKSEVNDLLGELGI